jgi:hypothetical protein
MLAELWRNSKRFPRFILQWRGKSLSSNDTRNTKSNAFTGKSVALYLQIDVLRAKVDVLRVIEPPPGATLGKFDPCCNTHVCIYKHTHVIWESNSLHLLYKVKSPRPLPQKSPYIWMNAAGARFGEHIKIIMCNLIKSRCVIFRVPGTWLNHAYETVFFVNNAVHKNNGVRGREKIKRCVLTKF